MYCACMETATVILIAAILGGGVCGGLLNAWGVALRCYRTECAVADLQAAILREVKKRAGAEGLDKRAEARQNLKMAQELQVPVGASQNEQTPFNKWW
jgi:hypothetical protein